MPRPYRATTQKGKQETDADRPQSDQHAREPAGHDSRCKEPTDVAPAGLPVILEEAEIGDRQVQRDGADAETGRDEPRALAMQDQVADEEIEEG